MPVTRTAVPIENIRPTVEDFGTCLNFDGSNDIVTFGTANPFSGSFYIGGFIKWNGTNGNYQTIFAKRDSYAADGLMFSASINPSGTFNIDTVTSFIPFAYTFKQRRWHHVLWVHNTEEGDELLYVDGILVSTQGPATLGTKTDALISFGACQNPATDAFWGQMDRLIYGVGVPTAEEAMNIARKNIYPDDSLEMKAELNEGSGSTATDSSGNGNNGTITSATYMTDKVLTARSLVGTDPYNDPGINLCLNPNCTSTGNYTPDPTAPTLISAAGFDGTTGYLQLNATSNNFDRIRFIPTWNTAYRGKRVVLSAYFKAGTGTTAALGIGLTGGTGANLQITGLTSTWTRYSVSQIIDETTTAWAFYLYGKNYPSAAVQTAMVDGVQLEIIATSIPEYPTNYFDGGMTNCSWSGSANASTSIRNTKVTRRAVERSLI